MLNPSLVFAFTVALTVAVIYLSRQLDFYKEHLAGARLSFWFGSSMLLLGTLWQAVKLLPDYPNWFIATAYPVINIGQLAVLLGGLFMVVRALAAFFVRQSDQQFEIEYREQKLNVLVNLQRVAREPYQFLELLNISIKEIVSTIPESAGAVFLVGRNRKQFILAASLGLTSDETSQLEYYPLDDSDDNIASQSLESAEPLVSGQFKFDLHSDGSAKSRFRSVLVLPLISGMDRIGGIILLSEKEQQFGVSEIKVLSPVAEWLAEKIKSARLARELSAVRKGSEEQELKLNDAGRRLTSIAALDSNDLLNNFCAGLKGFAGCDTAHLVGVIDGSFEALGGSEPLVNIGDSYVETLVDALTQNRPIVINQEAEDKEGRAYTTISTLVYPLGQSRQGHAILLRRESEPYTLDNSQLKLLGLFSRLALFALDKKEYTETELRRRRGLDKIVQLLRLPGHLSFKDDPGLFVRHLLPLFPSTTRGISFVRKNDGRFESSEVFGFENVLPENITVSQGEGFIGEAADGKALVIKSKEDFEQALKETDESTRHKLEEVFGKTDLPSYVVASPLMRMEVAEGVVVFFFGAVNDAEKKELEQFVTLASGLYSLRMTVTSLNLTQPANISSTTGPDNFAEMVNTINNYLSTVIGNAEILMTKEGLDNEVRSQVQSILNQAEVASEYVTTLVRESNVEAAVSKDEREDDVSLNDIARRALQRSHVSENLYMLAGRAREIELKLGESGYLHLGSAEMEKLFIDTVNHFASLAADEDVITLATYERESQIYLDISRHRRNFPPVESVAGFGSYQLPEDVIQNRPNDTYLKNVSGEDCLFAYDRFSTAPSYVSFKFPAKQAQHVKKVGSSPAAQILAVDDQQVILELISAMCQSLGYDVTTASSGADALRLVKENDYDVILTDLAMPGMSGLELARKIRATDRDTPIILVTGWEVTIDRGQLEEAGISDILYKPFRIEQLTNLVKLAATGQSA